MKTIGTHNYYVYIVTNKNKTVLYIGVTNNLKLRMQQHYESSLLPVTKSFAGKYNTYNLLYYERFEQIEHAIQREKELKDWRRNKKEDLINTTNPEWLFLNDELE